jgi:hypothetical protein
MNCASQLERAAQQVIGDDAPIECFSSIFLKMILDAVRGAHLNSSVRLLNIIGDKDLYDIRK